MSLKKSLFNKAVATDLCRRFWPLWAVYTGAVIFALPVSLASMQADCAGDMLLRLVLNRCILDSARAMMVINFVFAAAAAMFMYYYLFEPRCCGLMNSLPIRRETAFFSAFAAGLAPMLAVELLVWALTALAYSGTGYTTMDCFLRWLPYSLLSCVGFYSVAVFCASLSGQAQMLPLIYLGLNLAAWLLEGAINSLLSSLVYGYTYLGQSFNWLSAPVRLLESSEIRAIPLTPEADSIYIYSMGGLGYLVCFTAAALALALLGLRLIKGRHMESCGDAVAVKRLRPAFKITAAVAGSVCFACMVFYLFFDGKLCSWPAAALIAFSMLLGAFAAYFGSEMLIQKSPRVFKGCLKPLAIMAAAVLIFVLGAELDIFGYETRIPDKSEIARVKFQYEEHWGAEEDSIDKYLALHRSLVDRKNIEENSSAHWTVALVYELKDGSSLRRLYHIRNGEELQQDENSAINAFQILNNCRELVNYRVKPELEVNEDSLYGLQIYSEYYDEDEGWSSSSVRLKPEQALELYEQCILPDAAEGKIGLSYVYENDELSKDRSNLTISMEVRNLEADEFFQAGKNAVYKNYSVMMDSKRTMEWIRKNTELQIQSIYEQRESGRATDFIEYA